MKHLTDADVDRLMAEARREAEAQRACADCGAACPGAHFTRGGRDLCEPCGAPGAFAAARERAVAWLDRQGIRGPERVRLLAAWSVAA